MQDAPQARSHRRAQQPLLPQVPEVKQLLIFDGGMKNLVRRVFNQQSTIRNQQQEFAVSF
jgi:hypothetical protein